MRNMPEFDQRSYATRQRDEPGLGDDIACEKCGEVALDTGLECYECGHDNYFALTGCVRMSVHSKNKDDL